MKKNSFLTILWLICLQLAGYAQDSTPPVLQLSDHKTSSLIFPYPIKSVDRGTADILAQVPPEARNVLQVKAARSSIPETNLTVITSDGKLYSFPVSYTRNPATTVLQLDTFLLNATPVMLAGTALNEAQLEKLCRQLAGDYRFYSGIHARAGGVSASLEGIYTYDNLVFFRVVLTNNSPLPYTTSSLRFSIRERKQARRTALQEEEKELVYLHGSEAEAVVEAGGSRVLVAVLKKTAISRDKELRINLFEEQGDRHLLLSVRQRHLLQAAPLLFDAAY